LLRHGGRGVASQQPCNDRSGHIVGVMSVALCTCAAPGFHERKHLCRRSCVATGFVRAGADVVYPLLSPSPRDARTSTGGAASDNFWCTGLD
jgi:hypothetical protein